MIDSNKHLILKLGYLNNGLAQQLSIYDCSQNVVTTGDGNIIDNVEMYEGILKIDNEKLQQEKELKKELMSYEFQLNMALKEKESEVYTSREKFKEEFIDSYERINELISD